MRRKTIIPVLLLTVAFCGMSFGQTPFEPVDYELQTPEQNDVFSGLFKVDSLNSIDVAANGYGQWAVNEHWGWYLLTNKFPNNTLIVPTSSGCIAYCPELPNYSSKPFTVLCGSGTGLGTNSGQKPQSFSDDTSCALKLTTAESHYQNGPYQQAYQAYKSYLESCYNDEQSWRAFISMTFSNAERKPDTVGKNHEYRAWLKTVLYYNTTDPSYYCEDLRSIYGSYLGFDKADGADINAARAVARYILDSTDCQYMKETLRTQIQNQIGLQYELWIDSVTDQVATPFDTSTPSIDELDLSLIRKSTGAVATNRIPKSIVDLTASPNPFSNEISIEYSLEDAAIVGIELLDILGREVYRTERKLYPEGTHRETIITSNLTEGTYFVRLLTSTGETKTIKLILKY